MDRPTEVLANRAAATFVLVFVAMGGLALNDRLGSPGVAPAANRPDTLPPPLNQGARIEGLDSLRFGTQRTILLVLNTRCPFCDASVPFYRRLMRSALMDGVRGRLVVLGAGSEPDIRDYLRRHGLEVHGVATLRRILVPEIRATPALAVLDPSGAVIGSWSGQLASGGELEVWASLGVAEIGAEAMEAGSLTSVIASLSRSFKKGTLDRGQ